MWRLQLKQSCVGSSVVGIRAEVGADSCVWGHVTVGEDVKVGIGSAAAREGAAM